MGGKLSCSNPRAAAAASAAAVPASDNDSARSPATSQPLGPANDCLTGTETFSEAIDVYLQRGPVVLREESQRLRRLREVLFAVHLLL